MTHTTDTLASDRVHSFSWHDPMEIAARAGELTGLEFLTRVCRGELPPPPIATPFGIELTEVEPGRTVFSLTPAEWMFNPSGAVHGGVAATLLDCALGCAVHSQLPVGAGYATTDLQIRYIRAITMATGPVTATGTIQHAGRRQAVAEGRVEARATGKLIATATAACAIFTP
jgi:uncharacterized protein (TIGR00369 family)